MPHPPRPRPSGGTPAPPPRRPGRPRSGPRTGAPPDGARRSAAPPRARRARWPMRAVTGCSVLVLTVAGVGHALLSSVGSGIGRVDPFRDMKNRPAAGDGTNILLVGTDGRDKISQEERKKYRLGGAPCHCTDTIMIVHISEDRRRASVVSLPRDSYARIPAHTDRATNKHHPARPVKLNAAYAQGGPQLTVRTVEHMTKVKIDHYLEVDFTSFMRTVDKVGGVEICTAKPLKDSHTGLDLTPGKHRLNGGEALQYVRSRHIDADSDLGRMQRQQRFMAALIQRATSSGVLLNPMKFREVTGSVLGSVRADKGFGSEELLTLGRAMRRFTPSSSEFQTVPIGTVGYAVRGVGSTVKWDPAGSRRLFAALRADQPIASPTVGPRKTVVDVDPRTIRVQVENGTGTKGLGKRVDGALRATGFRTTGAPRDAKKRDVRQTVVLYDPRWDRSAKSLSTALPGSKLRAVKGQGATLKVLAGADFEKVRQVRAQKPRDDGSSAVRGDEVECG
ncbi:LCP family protein [Streptomyces sp. NA04227]|uniref:LCP family protein n=1 Tax=Streptomyces sp. NA04227 TaxID=2742136 RepID=UPI0020CA39BD|nr:LCP family protein [Streptomyces sp. NA04227]